MKIYKIGLFGFGCVGQGLYEALAQQQLNAHITKICVKDHTKQRAVAPALLTYCADEILNDESIDIVVELIDDPEFALEIAQRAMSKGKAVVSANKKMIAEHLDELISLQHKYDAPLLYEGAVCGSIPIIRNLQDYFHAEKISEIRGIFNGSSNYILSQIFQENKEYAEALKEAQDNGFAESDPTLDVGGFDPKFKLSILIKHTFGLSIHPDHIFNWGIQHVSKADIVFAKERGLKIKLLAQAKLDQGRITASIAPHFVDTDNPVYHIENEYNCVLLNGQFVDHQTLIGKGAGSLPTGLAVLADVVAITHGYQYRYMDNQAQYDRNTETEVYLSFENESDVVKSAFTQITESYTSAGAGYIIGRISLNHLSALLKNAHGRINAIFTSGSQHEFQIPQLAYSYAS